jgi:peptidoglycan/xylan/chitin deacetylase (PgdA/CDA1 family)
MSLTTAQRQHRSKYNLKRLFKLAVSVVYFLCFLPFDVIRRRLGLVQSPRCVVLYYHAVAAGQRSRFCRQMDLLLRWAKTMPASFSGPLEPGLRYAAVTFDDGFLSVLKNALPELEKRSIPSTIFIVTDYLGKILPWAEEYSEGGELDRVVTLEELMKMPSDLLVIGSHTVTHSNLTILDRKQALDELVESRRKLEKWLGKEVLLFSFPFGAYNDSVVDLCREAGYRRVFSNLPKLAFAPSEYVTGRVPAELSDWDVEFLLKLFGAYRWLPYAFSLKRTIRSMLGLPPQEGGSRVPHD